jgi:4-amino-4-deoxy-L-arabinose transferase-like glycosyltransferase
VLAYLAALLPAFVMAVTQPTWSLVDEAQHFDFIVQLSRGAYPAVGGTVIAPETLQVTQATGVYRAFYPPGTYPIPDLSDVSPPPQGISEQANAVWMQRHMWQLTHETVQTPLYYVAMVPVWWAGNAIGGPFAAIYLLRFINALIIATLAPMTLAMARSLFPGQAGIAALATMFAILLPGLDLNGTRVSNDGLAAAAGGLVVLLAVRWTGGQWSFGRAALMGLLFGAAMMVKITDAGLYPAVAIAMLLPAGNPSMRPRLARLALMSAVALACLAPWALVNLHNYGALTPGALAARWSDALPGPLTASFAVLDVAVLTLTYWTGEPWGALPLAALLSILGALIALTVPVAAYKLIARRPLPAARVPITIAVAAVAGMIAVSLFLPVAARFEFAGPGRYVYPALPAAAALCALGVWTVVRNPAARRFVAGAYAGLAVLMVGLAAAGLPSPPAPGVGVPPTDARTVSVSATGQVRGMTITVDQVAFDAAGHATWFEITATNSGPDEVEWTVPPFVSAGGTSATGQYLKSARLPGDLDAGQTVTGWLYVPLDPATVQGATSLHLRFSDVAFDSYRTLADVNLDVPVSGAP